MLTIKAPIQLHIAQGPTGNADTFGERIRGNYGMMGARYTPKDLLFLLIAPPELPEEMGGMTTLVSQQNNVDVRSVTMDVVNNVVNRIMLDGTQQFTYQDQVYITSVLNKLGVTNIQQFMEQIRQLRTENESTLQLTKLYRSELERVIQRQQAGENAPALPISSPVSQDEQPATPDPRVSMSLNILQRLDTTKLYETVHKFQRNWSRGDSHFQNNEFRLAEQLRFSNSISLAQIKQQVYEQPQLNLLHHLNRYETNVMMEAPENEEAVLSQAAAAALVTAVDNTVTEVLNRPQIRQEQWLRIENAISQTAENTLSRFETYHSQYQLPAQVSMPDAQAAWNYYAQELQEYSTLYQQMYPKAAEHGRVIGLPDVTQRQLLHLTNVEQGDEIRKILTSSIELTQDQRQTLLQAILLTAQNTRGQEIRETEHTRTLREARSHELERRVEREQVEHMLHLRSGEGQREWEQLLPVSGREIPSAADMPPMVLTDRVVDSGEGELTIEQVEQIEQFNRTLIQNAAQEMQRTREQMGAEDEVLHRTEILHRKTSDVMRERLTDSAATETGVQPTGEQGDYIDQTRRTLIRNIQQEFHRSQIQQGAQGDILHQTTIQPGAQEPVTPMALTDREMPEEGTPITAEQMEYIDQSSRSVLQNIQQEIRHTQIQQGADGRILHQTTVLPGGQESMTPMTLTDREVPEEGTPITAEQMEYIDQSSRSVLQNIQQEIHRTQVQQVSEGDVIRRSEILTAETMTVKPLDLAYVEGEEEGAALTGEQMEYIDQRSRTLMQNIQQEISDVQIRQTREGDTLHQTAVLPGDQAPEARTVEEPRVSEILRQLRPESQEQEAEGVVPPVAMTGREEGSPEITVEQFENIEAYHRTLLQQLEQERQSPRSQSTPDTENIRMSQSGTLGQEVQPAAGQSQGAQVVREVLSQLRPEGQEPDVRTAAPAVTLTAREAEEQAPELLVEQIERIEAHNRTLLQNLQQQTRERTVVLPGGPDMKRTMRDALRALEQPGEVLREIYDRQETEMVHPAFTSEEEEVLRRVDPASRAVYEQILAYQKDPEGTLAKGLLRPVSMGAFQAEIRKAVQETPLELEHQSPEAQQQTQLIREQSEIILERFHRMAPQQIRSDLPRQPGAVNIVHKEMAPEVTEELLEQLQQRTQTTVQTVTNEAVTKSQSHQVDVQQIEHKVVTQTTQDITELVNRTLARQMRTISDQVYRQMEKRLQSERSRRGRF